MDNKTAKGSCFLNFIIFLFSLCFISSSYGEIIAKPGTFDHYQIDAPDVFIAGNEYKIFIYALDAFGNPVAMPSESHKEYKITVTGSAVIFPDHFKANEITISGLAVKFKDEKAEEVKISLYEVNSPFPVTEKRIKILPAEINKLDIKGPASARAGSDFEVSISGKDRFNNTVCKDFDPKDLNLFFKGDVSPQIKEIQYSPENCNVKVKLVSDKIGNIYIEAGLLNKNITGKSEKIEVLNGPVNSFIVNAPETAIVDEPFDITILAIDKFNNFVKDFATQKERVIIEVQGKGYIFPTELSSYAFSEGKAKISLRYDRPEDIKILVKVSSDSSIRGESGIIKVTPPKVKRFEVISPETVIAGQRFKVKIIAYNQLDKIMSNYNLYGSTVILKTSGSGSITPNKIPPSEFINGVATVEVMYDKAEKFNIFATLEEKEIPSTEIKTTEKKVEKPKVADKKKTKKSKRTEKKSVSKGQVLDLKNISLVETKNAATLTLFIPDIDKYGGYSPKTKKEGKIMSVIVEVYPVKNKLETPVKIESDFIKEVSVSEKDNKVIANIILKKPLKYHLVKKKDELVVEFRRP